MAITKKHILYAAISALILTSLISCTKKESVENEVEERENIIQAVRVEALKKRDLRKFIEINGNIRAEKSMSVYPLMQGKITSTNVHLGSRVKKGDVIAYVDPSLPGSRYALNEVTSPISGTVISIPLKEGTRVNPETAVVTIGDLSKLHVITYIPERYVSFLKKGLEADIYLEAYPEESLQAVISEVSPVLDEASRTKEVILNFTKADSRINAGMFASIKLYLKEYKSVYSVPTSCIIDKLGKKYIYLIDDSEISETKKICKVRLTEIKTIEEIVDRSIIEFVSDTETLSNTENSSNTETSSSPDSTKASPLKVVVQGHESLQDGSAVNIAK
ncbi:MAG: efflux RND transporter periplasmic adaptor subunit [Treponema sp.]|nr:efflux RND transporter periplasmic adaptor subunit [Treponema sp.]